MIRLILLLIGASLLLTGPAWAQSQNQAWSPWPSFLQGQQAAENLFRSLEDGQAANDRHALYRAIDAMPDGQEKEAAQRRYFGVPPAIHRTPTVTNPYSPYLGLPTDLADGQLQQQILELNQKLDRLERARR
jgi:hypothetical protein